MKKITFLLLIFFTFPVMAQNITLELSGDPCGDGSPYTLVPFGTSGGKNQFNLVLNDGNQIRMEWNTNSARWEINLYDSSNELVETEFFNSTNSTPNPPCFSFDSNWSAVPTSACTASTVSGLSGECETSATNSAAAAASIPTLSEWGLIILALLLMTFGTLQLVKRESNQTT